MAAVRLMRTLALAALFLLSACATCERHPAACGVAGAAIVGAVTYFARPFASRPSVRLQRLRNRRADPARQRHRTVRENRAMSAPQAAQAVRHALALLECASSDCRHKGPSDDSTPLHWPLAVAAARAQLAHALARLEHHDVLLRQAAQRLQGWSAGAGSDGKLIGRIEDALGGHSTPRPAGQPDA